MAIDPDALLVGPRGRRLCLASAMVDGDHDLIQAVMFAAYGLDPGAGTSRVILTIPASAAAPVPLVSAHEVAALLRDVDVPALTERQAMEALVASVNSARYWQEPDGEDMLAGLPAVRDALRPVAERVVGSPSAAWWSEALDQRAQWQVTFDQNGPRETSGSTAEVLRAWRDAAAAEEVVARRERPADPSASWSGTWWSIPPASLSRTTRRGPLGPIGLWLVEDSSGWVRASVRPVRVPEGVRVHEVDEPDAWVDLCRRYPLEVTASRRHDWFRTTGQESRWVLPDWSAAAADVDAVHVTVRGYLTTAGRALPVADGVSTVLAGWAPDQTVWLSDVEDVGDPEPWARDDDGWHRLGPE